MAPPVLTTITPDFGLPGGKYLVTIDGTDFELPPSPSATGFVGGTWAESMEVEINGRLAEDVRVYSSTLLTCLVPSYRGDPTLLSASPGLDVDVTLRNLTGPEENTYTDAFTYKRQDYTRNFGSLAHIVDTLISELRRQVLDNVALSTSVDYDSDTADGFDFVEIAETPALALFGPTLRENRFRREQRGSDDQDLGTLEYDRGLRATVEDLIFTVTITSDSPIEMLQISQELVRFFERNQYLEVPQDTDNPTDGDVLFDMVLTSHPSREGTANISDQHTMSATFEIRGVPIDEDTQTIIESGYIADDPANLTVDSEYIPMEEEG